MLRKSDVIQRRDAARKQFMEDEDYNKWTETLDQLYDEAVPIKLNNVMHSAYVPMLNKLRHTIYEGHPKDIEVYKADKVIQQGKIPVDDDSLLPIYEPFEFNKQLTENPAWLLPHYGVLPYIKGKAYPYDDGDDFLKELVARKPKALKYLKDIHNAGYDVSKTLNFAQRLSGNDTSDIKASLSDNVSPYRPSYPDDTTMYRSIYTYPYKMQDKDVQSLKELLSNKDKFVPDGDYDALLNTSKDSDVIDYLKAIAHTDYEDMPLDMRNMYDKYYNGDISKDEYSKAVEPYNKFDLMFKYYAGDENTVNDTLNKYASDGIKIEPVSTHTLNSNSPHLEDYIPLFLTDNDDPDDTQKSITDTLGDRRF